MFYQTAQVKIKTMPLIDKPIDRTRDVPIDGANDVRCKPIGWVKVRIARF